MENPERVLVIVAHPDDIDFGAAGTIATWTRQGVEVVYCLVTSGDAGGKDLSQSFADRSAIREAEQTAAAAVVGVSTIEYLRQHDGRVQNTLELRKDLSRVIRQYRPDRVLTQSPLFDLDRIYASHPDHLAVGAAALAAVYPDARNPFAHVSLLEQEGLEPWAVPEVWIMGVLMDPGPQSAVVDITEVFDLKVAALTSHVSQTGEMEGLEGLLREWGTRQAVAAGLPEGSLAEVFRKVDTK